jgi:uncharacterized coiled-coil protein SlyX
VRAQTEIQDLKQIVVAQSATIQEMNQRYEASQSENRRLSEELKQIRDQLETIQNSPALNVSAQTNPQASYAQVARTPPTSQPSNVRTLTSMKTTPSTFTDTLYCTIDTSRMDDEGRAKMTAGTIRSAIEEEIRTGGEQKDWRCRAMTMDPRKPQRIKIICRDEAEHRLVKQAAEKTNAPGARVLRDELYPIKVDSVRRTAVLDENDNIRDGVAEAFGQENETTVTKVIWLSRKDDLNRVSAKRFMWSSARDALQHGCFAAIVAVSLLCASPTGLSILALKCLVSHLLAVIALLRAIPALE